jgi:hypothetical protein
MTVQWRYRDLLLFIFHLIDFAHCCAEHNSIFPDIHFPNSNSLERYDKTELSNQSSEDEVPLLLQISLQPSQRRFLLKPDSPTHITYCRAGDDEARKAQRQIDILPSHLKM